MNYKKKIEKKAFTTIVKYRETTPESLLKELGEERFIQDREEKVILVSDAIEIMEKLIDKKNIKEYLINETEIDPFTIDNAVDIIYNYLTKLKES